jgi:hypothetical protein
MANCGFAGRKRAQRTDPKHAAKKKGHFLSPRLLRISYDLVDAFCVPDQIEGWVDYLFLLREILRKPRFRFLRAEGNGARAVRFFVDRDIRHTFERQRFYVFAKKAGYDNDPFVGHAVICFGALLCIDDISPGVHIQGKKSSRDTEEHKVDRGSAAGRKDQPKYCEGQHENKINIGEAENKALLWLARP